MVDLAAASLETFAPHTGTEFTVRDEGAGAPTLTLELIEAQALPESPLPAERLPFSLIFRGPAEPALGQGIHGLEHAQLGVLEIFLVPLVPDRDGALYQAVFA